MPENNPNLFTKVLLGGEAVKLRMTPEYRWRILTLDNPEWASDFEKRALLAVACQIWALLDEPPKKARFNSVKDVLVHVNPENVEELMAAVHQAFRLANPTELDAKNANGSTPSPSPASS